MYDVLILPLSTICLMVFGNVPTVLYFFFVFLLSGTEVRIISSRTDGMPLLSHYGAYPAGNAFITLKIKASYDGV
jgi:hypothetical protein